MALMPMIVAVGPGLEAPSVGVRPRSARDGSDLPPALGLYWIPIGAGGVGFVRTNGRIYEKIVARRERRRALNLVHTALELHLPEGRFVIENAWPSPNADIASRGVVETGPVFSHRLGHLRWFSYEVRCWQDGVIADASEAVEGLQYVSNDPERARRLLNLVASVPRLTWGRRPTGSDEMWNSNSVVSWLLVRSGVPIDGIHPPEGASAPGWQAGIQSARRSIQPN